MSDYTLRGNLNDEQFEPLTSYQYLEKLSIVANELSAPEDREAAKDELLNAHFRLIAGTIHRKLKSARAKGGYSGPRDGIDIDGLSDLIISEAGHVYAELTSMAAAAIQNQYELSSVIAHRVGLRVLDKMRKASAKKRGGNQTVEELFEDPSVGDPYEEMERLMNTELYAEIDSFSEDMAGTKGLVLRAVIHGIEHDEDINITNIARALKIPETTARSAYSAAKKIVRERYPEMGDSD